MFSKTLVATEMGFARMPLWQERKRRFVRLELTQQIAVGLLLALCRDFCRRLCLRRHFHLLPLLLHLGLLLVD